MTYIVSNTDGSLTLAIEDGTINGTDYSVVLLGKNVIDYGRYFAQNSIRQLENFASASPPSAGNILVGQLWFDKSTGTLKAYDTAWRPVTTQHAQVDKIINYGSIDNLPPNANVQYAAAIFNNVDKKLYIDNGTRIQVAGYGGEVTSRYSTDNLLGRPNNYGTRVRTIYLKDSANVPRAVLALVYVNDTSNGSMNKGTTTTRWGRETVMMVVSDHEPFVIQDTASYSEGEEINYYPEFTDINGIGSTIKKGTNVRRDYTGAVELANQANEANVAYWLNTGTMGSPNPAGYIPASNVIHTYKIDGYVPLTMSGTLNVSTQNLGGLYNRFNQGFINTLTTNTLKVGNDPLNILTTGYTLPIVRGTSGHVLTTNGDGTTAWTPVSSGGGGVSGISGVTAGSGLTGGGTTGTVTVNVGQGAGISVSADAVAIDTTWFDNRVATLLPPGGSGLAVLDETTTLTGSASSISFVGAGVTATSPSAGVITVTIPGGGSSLTIPGSSGQLLYNNGGSLGALSALTYTAGTPNQFALTGRLSITDNLTVSGYVTNPLKVANQGIANEGGEIRLQKPTTGSGLDGDLAIDLNANRLRIFDSSSPFKGLFADITDCADNVGSEIIHSENFNTYLTAALPNGVAPKPRAYGTVNTNGQIASVIIRTPPAVSDPSPGFTVTQSGTGSVLINLTNTTGMSNANKVIVLATPHSNSNGLNTLTVDQVSGTSFRIYTGSGANSWQASYLKFTLLVYYADDLH